MKIYLVQHGEAVAKETDPERPLSEQGRQDVQRMADALADAGLRIERVIHSGKLRALQTAEVLAGAIAPGHSLETSDLINPNDDPGAIDLQNGSRNTDVMMVGHLPFMAKLVSLLVTGDAEHSLVSYRPGSVVCLESIDGGRWHINWMLRPELLN